MGRCLDWRRERTEGQSTSVREREEGRCGCCWMRWRRLSTSSSSSDVDSEGEEVEEGREEDGSEEAGIAEVTMAALMVGWEAAGRRDTREDGR